MKGIISGDVIVIAQSKSSAAAATAISGAHLVQNSHRKMFPGCPKPMKTSKFMACFQHAFL
jgi:hypothetical protein